MSVRVCVRVCAANEAERLRRVRDATMSVCVCVRVCGSRGREAIVVARGESECVCTCVCVWACTRLRRR